MGRFWMLKTSTRSAGNGKIHGKFGTISRLWQKICKITVCLRHLLSTVIANTFFVISLMRKPRVLRTRHQKNWYVEIANWVLRGAQSTGRECFICPNRHLGSRESTARCEYRLSPCDTFCSRKRRTRPRRNDFRVPRVVCVVWMELDDGHRQASTQMTNLCRMKMLYYKSMCLVCVTQKLTRLSLSHWLAAMWIEACERARVPLLGIHFRCDIWSVRLWANSILFASDKRFSRPYWNWFESRHTKRGVQSPCEVCAPEPVRACADK